MFVVVVVVVVILLLLFLFAAFRTKRHIKGICLCIENADLYKLNKIRQSGQDLRYSPTQFRDLVEDRDPMLGCANWFGALSIVYALRYFCQPEVLFCKKNKSLKGLPLET